MNEGEDINPSSGGLNVARDNVFAWVLGGLQVFFSMLNEWLATVLGYERLAGLAVIGIGVVGGGWLIYRMDRKDFSAFTTLAGLSGLAAMLLFVLPGQSQSAPNQLRLKSVVGEVFLDRNHNGFRDGADEPIQGVSVTLRDQLGTSLDLHSDARGLVSFSIPHTLSRIQIVACGVAQSHTLSLDTEIAPPASGGITAPVIYKIDIGIEHDNLDRCV